MNEAANSVPRAPQEIKLTPAEETRFWAKVNKNGPTMPHMETPCWIWTASKDHKNYGNIRIKRKMFRAHRVAWMICHNIIPSGNGHHGICVCHRCDNRACCRPDHLFLGTNAENMQDMCAKKRHAKFTKPECYIRGIMHKSAKLTEFQVIEIRRLYSEGLFTLKELGKKYGVHLTLVHAIIKRKKWSHI